MNSITTALRSFEVVNVTKYIGNYPILHRVSFEIQQEGSIIGIIGRNGAGKTTLLQLLAGIDIPDEGDVLFYNQKIHLPACREKIVFIPDSTSVYDNYTAQRLGVLYQLAYPSFDMKAYGDWLNQFEIPYKEKLRYFSRGMKALLHVILGLASRPAVLLLDEPTNGIDPIYKDKLLSLLMEEASSRRMTIFISSHLLEEIEQITDQLIFLGESKITFLNGVADSNISKYQIAFKQAKSQEWFIQQRIHILNFTGNIFTVLIPNDIAITDERIQSMEPVYVERLQLKLTDVYYYMAGGIPHV